MKMTKLRKTVRHWFFHSNFISFASPYKVLKYPNLKS